MEGSSFEGQVRDTNFSMEVTDNANLSTPKIDQQLGINTNPTQQEWLKQQAQNTDTTDNELWKHFPEGGITGAGDPLPARDPEQDFINNVLN